MISSAEAARPVRGLGKPSSGVFAIPLAVAALYDVAVARDEYLGLDRLDREELDETDDDAIVVVVPAQFRKSA